MPNHPEVELHRCAKCSHAFSRADSIAQPERYGSSYYEVDHKRWFEHPNLALFARVASFIPLGASVLDVGCGRGDFLRFARNSRPDLRLAGIDIAKNDESSDGVRFLQGDIFQMDADEHFDAIVSLAVIEHVADVTAFVRKLRELMKPRAIAAVMTLNDSSLLYGLARAGRRLGVPLAFNRLYSKHHLHHFTPRSLRTLFREQGFSVRTQFSHDAPIEAMDIPVESEAAGAVLRLGLRIVWTAGRTTDRGYLQTVICER